MSINHCDEQGYLRLRPSLEWARTELERRAREGIEDPKRHVLPIYVKLGIQWEEWARREIQKEDARAIKEKVARESLAKLGKKV